MQTKQNTRKLLALFLSLAMVFSMAAALGGTASAVSQPQPWPTDNIITIGGEYTMPTTLTNTTVNVTTTDPVTLIGKGYALGNDFQGISIVYRTTYADLVLQDVYISSPNGTGSVVDFAGSGNKLSVASGSSAILESNGYGNAAVVHVGKGSALTISGTPTSNLYLYKSSSSAAIGGNTNESSGAITFASGNTFAKGTQTGATIGGDDTTGATTNDDITIAGGILCVETNARGAGIGASALGQCAGDVFITGGSTLINVDWTGSAIGRGASGTTLGNLFISGGSLKVVIDPNAGSTWGTSQTVPTTSNVAITAKMAFEPTRGQADVAEVDVADLLDDDPTATITATITPAGGQTYTLYNAVGLNQYDYDASQTYTPDNWNVNTTDNTKLYLYLPIDPGRGELTVTNGAVTQSYSYTYTPNPPNASSSFTLTPITTQYTVTFATGAPSTSTVYINGQPVSSVTVDPGDTVDFSVVPVSGQQIDDVTLDPAATATLTPDGGGVYTLSNIQSNATVTVATILGQTYVINFANDRSTVTLNGVPVTSAVMTSADTLNFVVTPDLGYTVVEVDANGVPLTPSGGVYTLSNVTEDTKVVITTVAQTYTVGFAGGNDQVRVNNVSTTSVTVNAGDNLAFTVVPDLGYSVTLITANGTTIGTSAGTYTLSNVQTDYSVVVTTEGTDGYWTAVTPAPDWAGGDGSATTPFVINAYATYTIEDVFAKLLQDVNSGTSYAGKYFLLGGDVDLSDNLWAPIGGGRDLYNGVPLGNYFAGNLDGGGYTIDGIELTILAANVNAAGYGLFGRIDGGTVQNLTIDGSIHTDYNNNVVGGLVGYTNGNITNVINKASVTALGAGVSETAGIAAVAENTNTETVLTISGCVNFGAIRGRSRLAGIVGAAYCAAQDGTVIENSYNAGNITAGNGSGTAYVGGVVGYCVGKIANVYNTGDVSAILSGTRFFVGGIVGLLNGGGVFGSLSDSYNVGNITSVSTLGDTQPLYAYADNSPNVIIRNSVYNADGGMTQDQLGATWPDGTVKGVPTSVLQSQTILDVSTYLDPTYFDQYSADYPVLDIQVATLSSSAQADFVNALNAMTGLKNVLLISDFAVGISSSTVTIDIGDINGVIYRAPGYISNLFNVTGTGLMNFQSGTIDGNAAGAGTTSVAGSLIDIGGAGAQLTIGPGATLKNNTTTSNGAAVLVNSGTLVMNGGTITGNTTTGNGGGVYVAAAGTFNLNGGTISGNTATLGEGIYATGTNAVNYRIVINPGSSNIISVSDVIYLNGPNTRIDLNATLTQTNINGNLLIRVSNPGTARVVVRTGSITMASDSLPYIKRWTGDSMSIDSTDQTLIDYNGTTFTDALYESEN